MNTNTPEFKRWFGKSKVVDANGKPLVVYHGTQHGGFTAFDPKKRDAHHVGFFFTDDPELSATYSQSYLRDPFTLQSDAVPEFRTVADLQDFVEKHGFVQDASDAKLLVDLVRRKHHRVGDAWFLWESTYAPGEKTAEVNQIGPFVTEAHLLSFAKQHFRNWPQRGIYQVFLSMQHPFVMDAHGGRWDELKAADIVEGVRGLPIWQREDPAVRKMLLDLERKREVSTEWVTKFAKDAGCDGCIIRNCIDTNDEKKQIVADIYVVFEPTQIKSATNNRGTFDPHDPDIRNPRGTMKNPTYGTHPTALAKAHTAEGLLARMLADGADTFAKKVKWVAKHIPTVDDPQSFVGWVTASERKRKQTRIRKTRNPGVVEVSVAGYRD